MSQAAVIYCVIYCRISEDREGAGLGVERQEEDCRALAAQLGLTVLTVYTDNDISAYRRSTRKPRKGYEQMLAGAQAGRFAVIIAWHTDRLHRSNTELEGYIDVCQPRGIPTYTVKAGNLDLSTAAGRLVARQLGAVARYQSEHMGEQIQRAREQRVFSGGNAGGPRPFGFGADGLALCPAEAELIARAVQDVIDGKSLSAVCREWNAAGVLTSQGNPWTVTKLRLVLLRPRNAAILVYRGREAGTAPWPPLVPEMTWRQMRAILADPARRTASSNRVGSLGSGLYLCGKCGAPMKISTSGTGSKVRGYRCGEHNHLTQAAAPLDAYVEAIIVARLLRPDARAALAVRREDGSAASAQDALGAAEARLAELGTMYAAGEIDGATLKTATASLRAQAEAARARLGRAAPSPAARLLGDGDVRARWAAADLSVKRAVLAALMTVTIGPAVTRGGRFDPGRVTVEWRQE